MDSFKNMMGGFSAGDSIESKCASVESHVVKLLRSRLGLPNVGGPGNDINELPSRCGIPHPLVVTYVSGLPKLTSSDILGAVSGRKKSKLLSRSSPIRTEFDRVVDMAGNDAVMVFSWPGVGIMAAHCNTNLKSEGTSLLLSDPDNDLNLTLQHFENYLQAMSFRA